MINHPKPTDTQNTTPDLKTQRRAVLAGIGGLAAGAFLTSRAGAGDLNPPPGPISPTMKPLDQIEPRIAINRTNTPGGIDSLYRITQPGSYYLTGNILGEPGLHGIEITASGVTIDLMGFDFAGVSNSLDGIKGGATNLNNISILNGSVRNWGGQGINFGLFRVRGRVTGVQSSGNGGVGIGLGEGCTIINCAAVSNTGIGLVSRNGCVITDCNLYANAGGGISAETSVISRCKVSESGAAGIKARRSSIYNCLINGGGEHGIEIENSCLVINNNCSAHGFSGVGAGIRCTSTDNHIEGNICMDNRIGIDCIGNGNFIARNTCSGNTTNWSIAAGNSCLVVNATPAPAITGNSGGTSPGSTNPNANYTY